MRGRFGALLIGLLALAPLAQAQTAPRKTENVIVVMTDGLRWQEVFQGAELSLLDAVRDERTRARLKSEFWRETPEARRAALMPFVWSTLVPQGQLFGNKDKGSVVRVTNGKNFSYPGYSETLCGFADDRIDSNAKRPNPNVTVFEWLHQQPKYRGSVAAFGAWDVFPSIFNAERCGFPVNAGYDPLTAGKTTASITLLNRLKAETPRKWEGEPYDALTFYTAQEYLKANRPRVLFLSLGETDEWAHEGDYTEYLHSARRVDAFLKQLYETLQSLPQYRGKTTILFLPDHGRGDAPEGWKSHGSQIPGSEFTWLGCIGPDTPARGERSRATTIGQNQVAATVAAFLGEDYPRAVPKAGAPIADLLPGSPR
jgi:hypothetical protein